MNGRKVDIASYSVRVGDVISPREGRASKKAVGEFLELNGDQSVPQWIGLDRETAKRTDESEWLLQQCHVMCVYRYM